MDEKKDPPDRPAWNHNVRASLEPLRDSVQATRDQVAKTLADLQAELEKKKAVAARYGRR